MANAKYGNIWFCDTVGIISQTPVYVRWVLFYPNNEDDAFLLNWWDESSPITNTRQIIPAATITSTTTFTNDDTGADVLGSAYADGAVLRIIEGSGSSLNKKRHLIATAGDDDAIVTEATLTNEASKSYDIVAYPARTALKGKSAKDTNERDQFYSFPGDYGFKFPNLALETIGSSCEIIIGVGD